MWNRREICTDQVKVKTVPNMLVDFDVSDNRKLTFSLEEALLSIMDFGSDGWRCKKKKTFIFKIVESNSTDGMGQVWAKM